MTTTRSSLYVAMVTVYLFNDSIVLHVVIIVVDNTNGTILQQYDKCICCFYVCSFRKQYFYFKTLFYDQIVFFDMSSSNII